MQVIASYLILLSFIVIPFINHSNGPRPEINTFPIASEKLEEAKPLDVTLQPEIKPVDKVIEKPVVSQPVSSGAVSGCGDNFYANYIYMHESGCKLRNPNGSGCDGIGQACPSTKILSACPNMDYACQNAWFTNYANQYGGWADAYAFWLANHWW